MHSLNMKFDKGDTGYSRWFLVCWWNYGGVGGEGLSEQIRSRLLLWVGERTHVEVVIHVLGEYPRCITTIGTKQDFISQLLVQFHFGFIDRPITVSRFDILSISVILDLRPLIDFETLYKFLNALKCTYQ